MPHYYSTALLPFALPSVLCFVPRCMTHFAHGARTFSPLPQLYDPTILPHTTEHFRDRRSQHCLNSIYWRGVFTRAIGPIGSFYNVTRIGTYSWMTCAHGHLPFPTNIWLRSWHMDICASQQVSPFFPGLLCAFLFSVYRCSLRALRLHVWCDGSGRYTML